MTTGRVARDEAKGALTPVVQLHHVSRRWGVLGVGAERVGVQFDLPEVLAEHADAADVALLAGDRELEAIHPRQAPPAMGVTQQAEAAQGDIVVEQQHVHFLAMTAHQSQGALANAVAAPQPGGSAGEQQNNKQIGQAQHGNSSTGAQSLTGWRIISRVQGSSCRA